MSFKLGPYLQPKGLGDVIKTHLHTRLLAHANAAFQVSAWSRYARQFPIPPKCCAPVLRTASYPCQFGEGEHVVFAGNIVPKTLALFLQRSTKPGRVMDAIAYLS